jgi:hypothetical protein
VKICQIPPGHNAPIRDHQYLPCYLIQQPSPQMENGITKITIGFKVGVVMNERHHHLEPKSSYTTDVHCFATNNKNHT